MDPRGIRNNNPGNIRHSADPWQGLSPQQTDAAFLQFQTPEHGIRAIVRTLHTYRDRHGLTTPEGIIGRWAPPNENNTNAYVDFVAQQLGRGRADALDLNDERTVLALTRAIIQKENGRVPYDDETLLRGIRMGLTPGDVQAVAGPPARPTDGPPLPLTREQERAQEQARSTEAPSLGQIAADAIDAEWVLSNFMRGSERLLPDPDFRMNPQLLESLTAGLPEEYWSDFGAAVSEEHAWQMRDRALRFHEQEQRLAAAGMTGLAARIGAALLDPAAIAASVGTSAAVAPLMAARALTRGRRAALMAGSVAGANVALEGALQLGQPGETDWFSLGVAGFAGAGFGALAARFSPSVAAPDLMDRVVEATSTAQREMLAVAGGRVDARDAGARAVRSIEERLADDGFDAINDVDAPATAMGRARFDLVGRLGSSQNPVTRLLAPLLGEDAVGMASRDAATPIAAEEVMHRLFRQTETGWRQVTEPAFREWADAQGIGWFGRARAREQFNRLVTAAVRGENPLADYHPGVVRTAQRFRETMAYYAELLNNPLGELGQRGRPVRGFGSLEENPNYVPRIVDGAALSQTIARFGNRNVEAFVRRAIQEANRELRPQTAEALARAWVNTHMRKTFGMGDGLERSIAGGDMPTLRRLLTNDGGLDADTAERIVQDFQRINTELDAGASPRAKQRILMDENYVARLRTTDDAADVEMRLSDLLVNDADRLLLSYTRQAAGQVALARVRVRNPDYDPELAAKYEPNEVQRVRLQRAADELEPKLEKAKADAASAREDVQRAFDRYAKEHRRVAGVALADAISTARKARDAAAAALRKLEADEAKSATDFGAIPPADQPGFNRRRAEVAQLQADYQAALGEVDRLRKVRAAGPAQADDGLQGKRLADLKAKHAEAAAVHQRLSTQASNMAAELDTLRSQARAVETYDVPEYLIDGITSDADFDRLVNAVRSRAKDVRQDPKAAEADVERLALLYDLILGRPHRWADKPWAQALRMIRDYNFIRVMGQVGFAQLSEIGVIMGTLGLRAALSHMPAFRRAMSANGETLLRDGFARELEQIIATGTDGLRNLPHARLGDAGQWDEWSGTGRGSQFLGRVDGLLARGKRLTADVSGMTAVTAALQRWAAKAIVQRFADLANGGKPSAAAVRRLKTLGLDDAMQDRVFAELRQHTSTEPGMLTGKRVRMMNLDHWTDLEARAAFEQAVYRQARRVVQENSFGSMPGFINNALGATFFQFRTFMLGSWTKQTLHGIHMRDFPAFAAFSLSMVVGALAYTVQTKLQAVARDDADQWLYDPERGRLTEEKIAAAAFQRAAWSSFLPIVADFGIGTVTGEPFFDTRASSLPSGSIWGHPLANLMDGVWQTGRVLGNQLTGDHPVSQEELRRVRQVFPLQNTFPALITYDAMIQGAPPREPRR